MKNRKTKHADGLEIYRGKDGDLHWRAKSRNGRKLANGGEGYKQRGGCNKGIQRTATILIQHLRENGYEFWFERDRDGNYKVRIDEPTIRAAKGGGR